MERPVARGQTALLLHCVQNDLVKGDGPPYRIPVDRARLLQNAGRVLEQARADGIFVLYINLHLPIDDIGFPTPATDIPLSYPFVGGRLREGTSGATIVDELMPRRGERVIQKVRFGAFYATPLEHMLRVRGIDTLLIAGMYAEYGIEMTVREAWDRGFHAIVVSDCCGTFSPEAWERVMGVSLPQFARIRNSAEVLSLLER